MSAACAEKQSSRSAKSAAIFFMVSSSDSATLAPLPLPPGLLQRDAVELDLRLADVPRHVGRARIVDAHVAGLPHDVLLLAVRVDALQRAAGERAHDAHRR